MDDDLETPTDQRSRSQWWRWVILPIAVPVGAAVGSAIIAIMQWLGMELSGGYHEDGWYYLYIMPLLTAGCSGFLWCWLSSAIAPCGKVITGAVSGTVLVMLHAFLILACFTLVESTVGERVQIILATVATTIGAVIAVAQAHEEHT